MARKYNVGLKILGRGQPLIPVTQLNIKDEKTICDVLGATNVLLSHMVMHFNVVYMNEQGQMQTVPRNIQPKPELWFYNEEKDMYYSRYVSKGPPDIHILCCVKGVEE